MASYPDDLAQTYVESLGPIVLIAGVEDPRVKAVVRRAYEAGYEQGRRDMTPRDAIDL